MIRLLQVTLMLLLYTTEQAFSSSPSNEKNRQVGLEITDLPKMVQIIIAHYVDSYSYCYGINIDYQKLAEAAMRDRTKYASEVRFSRDQRFSLTTGCQIKHRNGCKNYSKEISVKMHDHVAKKCIEDLSKKPVDHEDLEDLYQTTGVSITDKNELLVIYSSDRNRSVWLFPKEMRFYSVDISQGPCFQLPYNGFHCFAISQDATRLAVAYDTQIHIYSIDHGQPEKVNGAQQPQVIDKITVFSDYSCVNLIFSHCFLIAQLIRENKSPLLRQQIHEGRFVFWKNQRQELESI